MSLKTFFYNKNNLYLILGLLSLVFILVANYFNFTSPKIVTTSPLITITPSITKTTTPKKGVSEAEFTQFIQKYQFMFWHLPNSNNAISLGWMNDNPLIVRNTDIFNPVNNSVVINLNDNNIALLNSQSEALIFNKDSQKIVNLFNKLEKNVDMQTRNQFTALWYEKPNFILSLSEDRKEIFLNNLLDNTQKSLLKITNQINPLSLSVNNKSISFTDKDYLYLFQNELIKIKLDDTTIESLTFWLNNKLFLVEKVTEPRPLDFIMLVDITNQNFQQIITSSSLINRLDLTVKPTINQKQDMVLFKEKNGLVWILSQNQAITRIYPDLKLPPDAWSNPAP